MGIGSKLGRLSRLHFIRYEDIRPAPLLAELPTPTFTTTPLPRNYFAGLVTSQDTDADHDINVAVGQARDTGDTGNILVTSTITKQLDATWAAGDDAGGLNDTDFASGSSGPEASTQYHVFLLGKTSNDAFDVGFDKNVSATNLLADAAVIAAGFTTYRRIASLKTDASENWVDYTQYGNHFVLTDPPTGTELTAMTDDTAVTITLPGCPTGISVLAECNCFLDENTVYEFYVSTMDQTDSAASRSAAPYLQFAGNADEKGRAFTIQTNTSAQFRVRPKVAASTFDTFNVTCSGWFDDLGQYD